MMVKLLKIWAFIKLKIVSSLYGKVGKFTYIMGPKYIINARSLYLGDRVRILYGFRCEIYTDNGFVNIHDFVSIGHNCHIASCEKLTIGKNTVVSSNVFIGSLDHDLSDLSSRKKLDELRCTPTIIGRNCFIGTGAVILPGSEIGDYSVVGAMTVVRGKYEEGSVISNRKDYIKKLIKD
jgi:acetyltransferase-like isoleucine patch superfamily enzyme